MAGVWHARKTLNRPMLMNDSVEELKESAAVLTETHHAR